MFYSEKVQIFVFLFNSDVKLWNVIVRWVNIYSQKPCISTSREDAV